MRTTTFFHKPDGNSIHVNGEPRSISVFDKRTEGADYICISRGYRSTYLKKDENGTWASAIWFTGDAYLRTILAPKRVNYVLENESIPKEKAEEILKNDTEFLIPFAEKAISWCDPKDENDEHGRYWLSVYRGEGVYRLIVKDHKIQGAIFGGFHNAYINIEAEMCSAQSRIDALYQVIEDRIGKDYVMLKADGSGTYFYLRYPEDAEFLEIKEYDVPSSSGGLHHNIEVI